VLQPLFDRVRAWIDAHDLTLDRKPALRPEPGQRNQFHLLETPKASATAAPAAGGWGEAAAQ